MITHKKLLALALSVLFACTGCAPRQELSHTTKLIPDEQLADGQNHFVIDVPYEKWERGVFNPSEIPDDGEFDMRSYDVSGVDLGAYENELKDVSFDTQTIWPTKLPNSFQPNAIMEMGKNPGLGIRRLHEKGITGKSVNIAIIDQALLLDHQEYAGRIKTYEMIHCSDPVAQMHGPAVTSIAIGKTVGVAPEANVYYIASTFGTFLSDESFKEELLPMAESIERILAINERLPENEKIKVISISKGITKASGYKETLKAIEKAKEQGIFVITTSTEATYGFVLLGLGREAMSDPDDFASYRPGIFWQEHFYNGEAASDVGTTLLVPMDARTYAGSESIDGYEFGASGGLSWSVPWLAGMYALCLEVKPDLGYDEFIEKCFKTGKITSFQNGSSTYELGTIINPEALIDSLNSQ